MNDGNHSVIDFPMQVSFGRFLIVFISSDFSLLDDSTCSVCIITKGRLLCLDLLGYSDSQVVAGWLTGSLDLYPLWFLDTKVVFSLFSIREMELNLFLH